MFAIPTDTPSATRIPSGDQPIFLYCGFAITLKFFAVFYKQIIEPTPASIRSALMQRFSSYFFFPLSVKITVGPVNEIT